ncbi:hypothetical protein JXI42_04760 [bacterium]|nr:hypothetical protein [bacterium]
MGKKEGCLDFFWGASILLFILNNFLGLKLEPILHSAEWQLWDKECFKVEFIKAHPSNPDLIFTIGDSTTYPIINRKLFMSNDKGLSWVCIGSDELGNQVSWIDIGYDSVIYADANWYDSSRIKKSSDFGETWINAGLFPGGSADLYGQVNPTNSDTLIISTCGLYSCTSIMTLDGGITWERVSCECCAVTCYTPWQDLFFMECGGLRFFRNHACGTDWDTLYTAFYFYDFKYVKNSPYLLYSIGGLFGYWSDSIFIWKSHDNGSNWNRIACISCDFIEINQTDTLDIFVSDGIDILRSTDGGDTWVILD